MHHLRFVGKPLQVDEEGKHHVQIGCLGEPRVGWKVSADEFLDEGSGWELHGW